MYIVDFHYPKCEIKRFLMRTLRSRISLRAQMWKISCKNALIDQTGCSPVAMVCKEAFSEWEKRRILFSESPFVRLYVSKTVFFLPNVAKLKLMSLTRQLGRRSISSRIQHIAVLVTGIVKLIEALSALSKLPSVTTIYLLLAKYHDGGLEIGSLCGMAQIAWYLDALTEDSSSQVKAFYTGTNAPQLKVTIPRCDRHCWRESTGVIPSTGLSLFDNV
ncbi:Uncharacterized protein HZ326_18907 [Fusarium oxysporum f. sp. albedinis]|nr:Uncharacterized protein HZ326_26118 [Fusarium oxysporum f. sp. albedinis]KAJ0138159.1 Uncharacterized protein HZ326_18907 [Fusarium oxysporum f. sp. albedinis]